MESLTLEQQAIPEYLKNNDGILLVDAKAGVGKSHTAYKTVEYLNPNKVLYTAFNKAIIQEGKELFPSNVECRTLHSLALAAVKPKLPIEDFTYTCIKEDISYFYKGIIINAIDEFYRSSSTNAFEFVSNYIKNKLANNEFLKEENERKKIEFLLTSIANNYIDKMINDEINPTFNYLLKWMHVLLVDGELNLEYDLVIFDEIQDSTGVALEIFQLLSAPKKLGLGDQHQSIYLFMNLVNGFEVIKDVPILPITKTFRCSTQIAKEVQHFGKQYLDKHFHFEGIDNPAHDGKTAYITATNASIIGIINNLHREGKGYILTRPIKEIFAAPLAVLTASKGKAVYHKKYKFLENEYKQFRKSQYTSFFKYLSVEVAEEEIKSTVKLLQQFNQKRINIFDVMNEAKVAKRDPRITVGTGFSLKGLGFETVHIHQDLNNSLIRIIEQGGIQSKEDLVAFKLYYVSCTRARCNLYNAELLKTINITL